MKNSEKIIVCSNCVLDSTINNISFNSRGICNFCSEFFTNTRESGANETVFQATIDSIKSLGHGKKYDCIIGLSGGVDSSYLAWLTTRYGLKPLAIHLDNGWNSELAVGNMEKICKSLDIDLITYVMDWTEFRDIQYSFLKAAVANADAPTDHAIFAILYRYAKKYKIKYILDGVNTNTEYVRQEMWDGGYTYIDFSQIKGIHKRFGSVPFKTYPGMSMFMKFVNQAILGIRQVSLLNLIDYNKADAIKTLKDEIGWKPYDGKHHESLYTKWHQLIHLPYKFKFDIRKLHLSDLILSGQIARNEALRELSRNSLSLVQKEELSAYVRKKLDLSQSEYDQILNGPPRGYSEYPNSKWMLDLYQKSRKVFMRTAPSALVGFRLPDFLVSNTP